MEDVMKVIQTRVTAGEDRTLHLPLPAGVPDGELEVIIVVEPVERRPATVDRLAAIRAGRGMLKGLGLTVDEFLAERREDDARRDKALGL